MKTNLVVLAVFAMAIIIGAFCEASNLNVVDKRNRLRRSLCNTFGGCGEKRSIQDEAGFNGGRNVDLINDETLPPHETGEFNANLVAEILNDLIVYLRSSEKYKRGKYLVLVPRRYGNYLNVPLAGNDQPD